MNSTDDLREPCFFCGGNFTVGVVKDHERSNMCRATCSKCGARGPIHGSDKGALREWRKISQMVFDIRELDNGCYDKYDRE
ncbi:MAG: hypothetical protein BWY63_01328 [Chloroflexi bacterium ADurb.Bin360]|nr:MAG: hypothetical protein BWY63_01328 [Chloroflexi bacterium ADurb.Bin360]